MKKVYPIISIVIILFSYNCTSNLNILKDGMVQFVFDNSINQSKITNLDSPWKVCFSIINENKKVQYHSEIVEFINFNGYYQSSPVLLKPGNYQLKKFLVLDEKNNVIFAAPTIGSTKASLIPKSLPVKFSIQKNKITELNPPVLNVKKSKMSDFVSESNIYMPVKTFDFSILVYESDSSRARNEPTNAFIKVTGEGDYVVAGKLKDVENIIHLKDESQTYTLEIYKPSYQKYKISITNEKLKSLNKKVLEIILKKETSIPGLIAYYPLNGDANDYSGNGNNGTNFGSEYISDSKGNYTCSFDGESSYIELNQAFDLKEGSYSLWFNSRSFPVWDYPYTESMATFFGVDNPDLEYGLVTMNVTKKDNQNQLFVKVGGMYDQCEFRTPIIKDRWYHVVLTKDTKSAKVYINNELLATKEINFKSSGDGCPNLVIGSSRSKSNRFFNGMLDEIKIFNRVLNEDEILKLHKER